MYRQCAAHAVTMSGICGVFAVTLIWIVQNYLQLLLYLIVSMIAIHLCMVLQTLTSPTSRHSKSTGLHCDKVTSFTRSVPLLHSLRWLPVKFRILLKTNLLIYKTTHKKQPVYLHSVLAASLPSLSLRSSKGISLSVPSGKTNTGARAFHSFAPSLWNNLPLVVCAAISVATFKKHPKTYLFDLDSAS